MMGETDRGSFSSGCRLQAAGCRLQAAGIGVLCFIFLLSGCATVKELAGGFAGISTKTLEDNRKEAAVKTFNIDFVTCYNKVRQNLVSRGSYLYAQDLKKGMLAFYVSQEDTTPVGVFFSKIDALNTKVEVSSPSVYAKELISTRVFLTLKEESDEKKAALAAK
jgi:hypothetical protein